MFDEPGRGGWRVSECACTAPACSPRHRDGRVSEFSARKTAKRKSDNHGTEWGKENDEKLKSVHAYDFHHFKKVGFWWYIFLIGALVAVLAKFIDWWGKPVNDWLTKADE
jgi:hypothetical protein